MQYYVFKNPNQEEQLEKLKESHDNIKDETDDFKEIIIELVAYIKKNKQDLIHKPYINQIFNSVNQVVYSFKNFKEAKNDPLFEIDVEGNIKDSQKEFDEQEVSMALVFLINSKAFLELVKKFTSIKQDDEFSNLLKSITTIRNYFAHYYEKKIEERDYFIGLSIERGLREYSILTIRDMKSGEHVYEVCLSFDLFYFSLKNIFKQLKDSLELFH